MPCTREQSQQPKHAELLEMFDQGHDLHHISRTSPTTPEHTQKALQRELDKASGPTPGLKVVDTTDGEPSRVSWNDHDGVLRHRPIDGPFPSGYPQQAATEQCSKVLQMLAERPYPHARQRAFTMLLMAEAGLHSFSRQDGKDLRRTMADAQMDEDAMRTVILNLHDDQHIQQTLLNRCGINPRWMTGNPPRTLARRMSDLQFPAAVIRHVIESLGNDTDNCYLIGPSCRIPEPSQRNLHRLIQKLLDQGLSNRSIKQAIATLGIPLNGRALPKKTPSMARMPDDLKNAIIRYAAAKLKTAKTREKLLPLHWDQAGQKHCLTTQAGTVVATVETVPAVQPPIYRWELSKQHQAKKPKSDWEFKLDDAKKAASAAFNKQWHETANKLATTQSKTARDDR